MSSFDNQLWRISIRLSLVEMFVLLNLMGYYDCTFLVFRRFSSWERMVNLFGFVAPKACSKPHKKKKIVIYILDFLDF